LPGKYSARLTAGGHTETAEFTVKMDPRVKASPADLQKQFELEMKVASGVSQSSEALTQARSIDEQITKLLGAATGQLKDSLTTLGKKVPELLEGDKDTTTGGMKEPALTDTTTNLIALYKAFDQSDAAPTVAQIDASTKNEAALETMLAKWNVLRSTDIPQLNQQLKSGGLPALRLDLPPQQQEGGEDEE